MRVNIICLKPGEVFKKITLVRKLDRGIKFQQVKIKRIFHEARVTRH